jgi:hypothetical protein
VGLVTIFYGLRFETSLLVASYDSLGYSGGIRPCLHRGIVLPVSHNGACSYLSQFLDVDFNIFHFVNQLVCAFLNTCSLSYPSYKIFSFYLLSC